MNTENKTWEAIKADYLLKVDQALLSTQHPRSKDILDEVRLHLEKRFAELSPEQHSWEYFQRIITDMGPPLDYAELLNTNAKPAPKVIPIKYLLLGAAIVIVMATIIVFSSTFYDPRPHSFSLSEAKAHPAMKDFIADPEINGHWTSVDFVQFMDDFDPKVKRWPGDLFLKEMTFFPHGGTSLSFMWTKDWIYDQGGQFKAQYKIITLNNDHYLFFPWLSGDVTIRGEKPYYYVLKKTE